MEAVSGDDGVLAGDLGVVGDDGLRRVDVEEGCDVGEVEVEAGGDIVGGKGAAAGDGAGRRGAVGSGGEGEKEEEENGVHFGKSETKTLILGLGAWN